MAYYVRLFATSPLKSLLPIQAHILEAGYAVKPLNTRRLNVEYHQGHDPLTLDLTDSNHYITREEILSFLELVSRLAANPERYLVLNALARTQALVAIGVADDYDEDAAALDTLVTSVAYSAEGLFQVDGQGFYDGHELILKVS